ncbi:MAG: DNA primase catalytic subunit PriS [Candidatus Hodarchaeales archaeon]|jgi:DNA primase small subunit
MSPRNKREALKDYYNSYFDVNNLKQVIDFETFSTREFGFVSLNGKFYRNYSFEEPKQLQDFMIDRCPTDAYIGAVYDEPPTRETPIHKLQWKGHELVFDIDLTDYDAVRKYVCDCIGAGQVCTRCWQLINVSIIIIDETLRRDFGINEIVWLFSGRRGVHAWVLDAVGFNLDREQRQSIIDYLSVIRGDDETARVQDRSKLSVDFRKRIESTVFEYYLKNIRRKDLIELGLSASAASSIIKQLKHQEGRVDDNLAKDFNYRIGKVNKYDEIIRRWAPRIDHKVSIDLRRLLRMPTSIHGKTGCVARILDPDPEIIFNFNPDNELSIFPAFQEAKTE